MSVARFAIAPVPPERPSAGAAYGKLSPGELLDLLDRRRHDKRLLGLLRRTAVLMLKNA